jgi:AcrR family transcriptional regulator
MPRPDVSEERRPQIIDAAIRVFLRKGYRNATMPDVAREAGLSIGGVYWYFKSKDEIVMDILGQVFQSDLDDLNQVLSLDAPTAERVRTYVAQYAEHYDDYAWLDPVGIQFFAESAHDPKMRKFIRKYLSHYRQVLTALVEQGVQRGEFKRVHPPDVANAILSLEEGLSMLTVVDPQGVRWSETYRIAMDLFVAGLLKKETEK